MGRYLIWFLCGAMTAVVLFFVSFKAGATVNTLTLTDEYMSLGVKVCVYEGSGRVEYVKKYSAGACPTKKTFK